MLMANEPQSVELAPDLHHHQQTASLIRWTHGLVNRIVMTIDALVLLLASGVFWAASPAGDQPFTWLQAGAIAMVTLLGFHITMRWLRRYRVERYGSTPRSIADVWISAIVGGIPALVIAVAFLPNLMAERGWLLGWGGAVLFGLLLGRLLARWLVHAIRKRALLRPRAVVVGAGPACDAIVARLRDPAFANDYQLLGVIDPLTTTFIQDPDGDAGAGAEAIDLMQYAQNYAVDLVIIALSWERSAEIFALTRRLQWIAADVVVPFDAAGLSPQFAPRMAFVDAPLIQLMHRPFKGTQGLFKVAEDYVIGLIAVTITCPVMLAAALAIRLEGTGPILFRQPRVGFNSKPFMMYKFRTMTVDPTDDGSRGTQRDSQRITRVGRLLRKSSIDELPQLFNVLRGEMSIVGPRPHVSKMLVGQGVYSEVVQQYAARHRIKPGITGWAQINGMRGGIDSVEKASRGADLDLYYVANWSLLFDIKIMIKTLITGLIGRNVF
jgi:putative colanic acid biosynthesis UDP-glucose lipid carrier transferase